MECETAPMLTGIRIRGNPVKFTGEWRSSRAVKFTVEGGEERRGPVDPAIAGQLLTADGFRLRRLERAALSSLASLSR
jgi:hypothetical protein